MKTEIRIEHAALTGWIHHTLVDVGVPETIAQVEAEVMAEADLQGVPSHGVRMLAGLVEGLRDGRVCANPQMRVTRARGVVSVLDGDNGPGRYGACQAMQSAMERGQKAGVGVCLATRTTHWGRAHAYASQAAKAGMIGLCTTNAIPNMLGWGSDRPLLGNNPLAIGVPRDGPYPIVLDMAMSQAAVGKIGTFLREGRKVPQGWGLDRSGQPTDDPGEILAGRRILPFGEHKGVGLALMLELITGALAGGQLSHEIRHTDPSGLDPGATKLFLALDVEAFAERQVFMRRAEDLLAWITAEAGPGVHPCWPGDRGWQTRERYLTEGIPIHPEIARQLQSLKVPLPWG